MGKKCCVPNCDGNYKNKKERVFRLPRNKDEKARWFSAIPRMSASPTKETVICERHWPADYDTVNFYGHKRPSIPPSVFKSVLPSLIPTRPPLQRTTCKTAAATRNLKEDQLSEFNSKDIIQSFNILKQKLNSHCSDIFDIVTSIFDDEIMIQSRKLVAGTGMSKFTLKIKNDLKYESYHYGVLCRIETLSHNTIQLMERWSHITEAIRFLKVREVSHKVDILRQQLAATGVATVGHFKYSTETIVRSFGYLATSRSAYSRLRQDYELPSISTLTRLTSKVKHLDDVSFLSRIFSKMADERQKTCALIIDEVYVKSMLQYHGGCIFGEAANKPEKLANTVLSFMIVCMFGGPTFLCKMIPVKELDASFLHEQTLTLLGSLKTAGADVTAIICDGNKVNQSFFKKFDTIKPWRTSNNIFLLFDFVHILKNVRNNWITEKTKELVYNDGENIKVAKWSDIELLHKLECNKTVKLSKLTEVSVYPKPIERQKVSTCLQVFNERTISALKTHPDMCDAEDTANFLSKIVTFWDIVNVHCVSLDLRFRNSSRSVIKTVNDDNLKKLSEIADMANRMFPKNTQRIKSLTKDTSKALSHTCNGLIELSKYLLTEKNHDYVLLGKYTSDPIEK
jgi:hypothetical protein